MTAPVPHAARLSVLARLQLGLEALYRVETRLPIDAFVVDAETRDATLGAGARAPREQLVAAAVGRRARDGAVRGPDRARQPGTERSGNGPGRPQLRRLLPGRRRREPLHLPGALRRRRPLRLAAGARAASRGRQIRLLPAAGRPQSRPAPPPLRRRPLRRRPGRRRTRPLPSRQQRRRPLRRRARTPLRRQGAQRRSDHRATRLLPPGLPEKLGRIAAL